MSMTQIQGMKSRSREGLERVSDFDCLGLVLVSSSKVSFTS